MKKITDIYEKYDIMPNLKDHMLRVGAVAHLICENIEPSLLNEEEKRDILETCLLHDMGNIVKFDLNYFPDFLNEKGLEYWGNIKEKFIKKYGEGEHEATENILKELNIKREVINLIGEIRFSLVCKHLAEDSFIIKIVHYSDFRVGPFGVLSFEERMEDGKKRYQNTNNKNGLKEEDRLKLVNCGKELEKQIFLRCKIKPEDINDITVAPIIKELENFEIKTN